MLKTILEIEVILVDLVGSPDKAFSIEKLKRRMVLSIQNQTYHSKKILPLKISEKITNVQRFLNHSQRSF